jgi:ubiquinol oxidase
MTVQELREKGYTLGPDGWLSVRLLILNILWVIADLGLQRILFLETIAGVPGMVAATLRHLHSLRLMVSFLYYLYRTSILITL